MGFSVGDILRATVLILNGLAIISERRVLEPLQLTPQQQMGSMGPKAQISTILASVRTLLRGPLIIMNSVLIAFAIVF